MVCLIPCGLKASILFSENFDSQPYEDGIEVPTGPGDIDHGQWATKNSEGSSSAVSREYAFSGERSVALLTNAEGRAAVSAIFGPDASGLQPTREALKVKFAFYLPGSTLQDVCIYSKEGILAYAQIVVDGANAFVRPWFDGAASQKTIPVSSHSWYVLEFTLPANPGPDSEYEIRVQEGEPPNERGSVESGKFYVPPTKESSYRLLSITNQQGDSAIFLDDFQVEAVGP